MLQIGSCPQVALVGTIDGSCGTKCIGGIHA